MHIIVLPKPPATQGFSHLTHDLVMSSVVPASPLAIVSVWVGGAPLLERVYIRMMGYFVTGPAGPSSGRSTSPLDLWLSQALTSVIFVAFSERGRAA